MELPTDMHEFCLSFEGYKGDHEQRRLKVLGRFLGLIGYDRAPSGPIKTNLSSQDEVGELTRRRYLVRKGDWDPQPIYEVLPSAGDNGATILALHGHGNDPFSGIYDYVYGLARRGYRVVMPILFGTMERETKGLKPDWRDICREWSIEADVLGISLLGARLHDARLAYDLCKSLEGVDPDRIGCAGLSMGGELSLYLAAVEPGIRACVSAGFLSSFQSLLLRKRNCQCYSIRGWPAYFDMPDIAACIAPRPLQIQKVQDDGCFEAPDVESAFEHLQSVYDRLGAARVCEYRTSPGGHILNQDLADAWFRKHLA